MAKKLLAATDLLPKTEFALDRAGMLADQPVASAGCDVLIVTQQLEVSALRRVAVGAADTGEAALHG
ncbi:MAG: hypothetical protein ACRETT_00625 [Steroidobacteraceae bacterium]